MKKDEIEKYRKNYTIQQLNEMAKMYDEGEKIANIIKKYNLNISINQISYFLPTIETDKICPYCETLMRRRRKRDTYYSDDIRCEECGHYYNKWNKECECENCQKKKKQLIEWKKDKIKNYYTDLIPKDKIEYIKLNYNQRCLLFILYRMLEKTTKFNFIERNELQEIEILKLIKKLKREEIIYVSPESKINAFTDDDFPTKYYTNKVDYIVNVSFSEEDKKNFLKKKFDLDNVSEIEIKELMYELMYEDLLIEFERQLEERNIDFEPTDKQLKDFRNLLHEGAYTQIRYICYVVARYYSDGIITGRFYRRKVPQQVLASVVTFFRNNMNRYGDVYRSDAEYVGKILRIFIEHILNEDVSILNEII